MAGMVKISEAATLALHTMAYLAGRPGKRVSVKELGRKISASEAHLAKVLQRLGRAGLVKGSRGPTGGYVLTQDPKRTTLLQVVEVVEGPLDVRTCLMGTPVCDGKDCMLGDVTHNLVRRMKEHLVSARVSQYAHLFAEKGKGNG